MKYYNEYYRDLELLYYKDFTMCIIINNQV